MNKIVLDKENYSLNNQELDVKIIKKNITLEINGNVKINDLTSNEDINLNIILNDNSSLIYNKYNKNLAKENINIDIKNNTVLSFNQSVYNELEGSFIINANINGSNNKTDINFYGVTNQYGKIFVSATGNVIKNVKNNDMLENVRILSLNNQENIIEPNLLVSSDEVSINHNATISYLDDDYLFYLNSKGISKEEAARLITKGFLMNKLDLSNEEKEYLF